MKEHHTASIFLSCNKWLKLLNLNEVDIYPIQFANLARLWNNDAVYIFDEVGSGKTISSGIMALGYLSENEDGKILVVTTNSLARYSPEYEMGQFKKDWMDKLPFIEMGFNRNIEIANNHYSKFKEPREYDLVIIDEAHAFLNNDTKRYINFVKNVKASKLVFLTATPIKTNVTDLHTFVTMAEKVLQKKLNRNWIADIETTNKEWESVLCSEFDIKTPVTRYFKDTITALKIKGYKKTQAKRLEPFLWEYNMDISKDDVLLSKIKERLLQEPNSRFVLFTRFVEKEAMKIGEMLQKNGYKKLDGEDNGEITYYVVTGKNANELSRFSGTTGLPTILILTYQISEHGLNLPGFNHVINYHIPAYPSALEQRFGRIDRMGKSGSVFDKIYMCYLIKSDGFDNCTSNFYQAVATYVYSMLSYLPSKNTLLSPEILNRFISEKVLMEEYTQRIQNLCSNEEELDKVINYYKTLRDIEESSKLQSDDVFSGIKYIEMPIAASKEAGDLLNFCDGKIDIDLDFENIEDVRKNLVSDIQHECRDLKSLFEKAGNRLEDGNFQEIITNMRDKILYCKFKWSQLLEEDYFDYRNGVCYMDAVEDCGHKISQDKEYKEYVNEFNEHIKIPILFEKIRDGLNCFYESKFINNEMNYIFPAGSHKDMLTKGCYEFNGVDDEANRKLLLDNIDSLVTTLPFFDLIRKYKSYLLDAACTNEGYFRVRFDFDPLSYAIGRLSQSSLKVSKQFIDTYFSG